MSLIDALQFTASLTDSPLFQGAVTSPQMIAVYNNRAYLQAWIDVEAALAQTQAEMGMIPQDAADAISAKADLGLFSLPDIQAHGRQTTHTLIGVLREFRRLVGEPHQTYIHYGATTQDIIDTGTMLLAARGHGVIDEQVTVLLSALRTHIRAHKDTVMVARSHGNHALPMTFAVKAAGWADEMARGLERWRETGDRALVGSMVGAVGTFAAWGDRGIELQERVCARLGLNVPSSPWQNQRDRVAELGTSLALLGGTLERIAQEVYVSSMTEIGEITEPYRTGVLGSSTMPHKINPFASEWVIALTKKLRGNAVVLLDCMAPMGERDGSPWRAEWITLPESFMLASAALAQMTKFLPDLAIHTHRMKQNIGHLKGLLLSERAMFVLSEAMPLDRAHHIVHEASRRVLEDGVPLIDALMEREDVTKLVARERIEEALEPANYLGQSDAIADAVLARLDDVIGSEEAK